jgi:DNA-binding NarL/FixJ family response regulator
MPPRCFQVIIIEDDPYANDLMMMLLARDYRTHVVAELSNQVDLRLLDYLGKISAQDASKNRNRSFDLRIDSGGCTDVVILDTEVPWAADLPLEILEKLSAWENPPKVLCTCTYPNIEFIEKVLGYKCFSGYLIKGEALYAMASAVCLVANEYCVITPEVRSMLEKEVGRGKFPEKTLVLSSPDTKKLEKGFSQRERKIFRLGLFFNLPQSDICDELIVSETLVSKTMTKGYAILQIPDIISGNISLEKAFNNNYIDNRKIIDRYKNVISGLPDQMDRKLTDKSPKFKGEGTLAFHLLTRPYIEEWN